MAINVKILKSDPKAGTTSASLNTADLLPLVLLPKISMQGSF